MYDGYMSLDGVEVINKERAAHYIRENMRGVEVRCDSKGLWRALGEADGYSTPAGDAAPWYRASNPATGEFYGFVPSLIEGDENSTRAVEATELMTDGAIHHVPRFGSKEIRVRGRMYAKTDAGMDAGMSWLKGVLEGHDCGTEECETRALHFFTADPSSTVQAEADAKADDYARFFPSVELLDGLRVVEQFPSKRGRIREVEFILHAGKPWRFTAPVPVATTTGVTPGTAAEVDCPTMTDAYDALLRDPNSGIVAPPRPPQIAPLVMPASWSRYQMNIASTWGDRHGRLVPVFHVANTGTTDRRMVRIRVYRTGHDGECDFESEFLVTYLPASSTITVDGIMQEISITKGGVQSSAGHLVVGSKGRPRRWAALGCGGSYKIIVDSDGGLASVNVATHLSIRE